VRVLDDVSSGGVDNVPSAADLVIGDSGDGCVGYNVLFLEQMWCSRDRPIARCSSRRKMRATDTANVQLHGRCRLTRER
jgi:hypothetical protein